MEEEYDEDREDTEEMELEDLDEVAEEMEQENPAGDIEEKEGENSEGDTEELELEDLDEDTEESASEQEKGEEEENPMPPVFLQNISKKLENFRNETTGKAKEKGDEWFDKAMNTGSQFYEGHKDLLFGVYDKVMNLKDNLKTAYKKKFKKKSAPNDPQKVLETKTGAAEAAKKEPKTRFGRWLAERKAKKAEKEAGKEAEPKKPGRFSKIWGSVKTGAVKLIQKVANTSTGRWIQDEIRKGKEWLDEQMPWLEEKKQKLLEFKNRISDELDDHEHERRMALKAKNGDEDYENRYNQYVQDLSKNEDIQALLRNMSKEEITAALNDLENNVGDEGKKEKSGQADKAGKPAESGQTDKAGKPAESGQADKAGKPAESGQADKAGRPAEAAESDKVDKPAETDKPGSKVAMVGELMGKLGDKSENENIQKKLSEWISPEGTSIVTGALHGGGALLGAISNVQSSIESGKREKAMKELHREIGSDRKLGHLVSSQQELARRNKISSGFDVAKSITTGAEKILKIVPGGKSYSKVASVAGLGVDLAKKGIVSSMESKSVKSTLKELLGGPEGYRKLKDKYQLQAQEMRRGIRESLGVRELKDVADMEQANLVDYAQEKAAAGDSNAKRTLSGIGDEAVRDIRNNAAMARKNKKTYRKTARAM